MKLVALVALVVGVIVGVASRGEAEVRCTKMAPLCKIGTTAVCLCESEVSMKCGWVCASVSE